MKPVFAFFLGALITSSAFAATDCSNPNGTLVYHEYRYEGGPAPMPGQVVGSETWTYQGKVIAKVEQHQGEPYQNLPIKETEVPSTRVSLESHSGTGAIDETYVHKVTLTREDGGAVLPGRGDTSVTDYFLCHELQHFYP